MKKRKRNTSINAANLFNIKGIGDNGNLDSIDSLLDELEAKPERTSSSTNSVNFINEGERKDDVPPWDFSKKFLENVSINSNRVLAWKDAVKRWMKTGNYSEGLLPNFELELARHFQVEKLSGFLLDSVAGGTGGNLRMPTFERWLIDSKLEEPESLDLILPNANIASNASQRLLGELSSCRIDSSNANTIVQNLCHQCSAAVQELSVLKKRTTKVCPLKKGDRINIEDREDGMKALIYNRKSWKKPYCIKINDSHYSKLKEMFEESHGKINILAKKQMKHAFHLIIMCLLLRYSSLSGGQLLNNLRGGGMQGAIHPHVFQTLHKYFERPCIEVFASPFNAHYLQFGSAFPCLDWHFGSIGDFFDQDKMFDEGCFEANPPFSPGLMIKMAAALQRHISKANKNHKFLVFVVIVPSVTSIEDEAGPKGYAKKSYELLCQLSSREIVLKSRHHGYVEGSQHLKPTRYKQSSYDTSVFIIQSNKAEERSVNLKQLEDDIRDSFRNRDVEELQKRRKTERLDIDTSSKK